MIGLQAIVNAWLEAQPQTQEELDALLPSAEGATTGRDVQGRVVALPPLASPSPPNATVVLSNLGENWKLRFFMNTEDISKILISRATIPSPNSSRRSSRVAFGEG